MVYEGYVRIGGVEVVNSERVRGYAETSDCPLDWLRGDVCEGLRWAYLDMEYVYENISYAPWYDPSMPDVAGRFYGVFGLELSGLSDSTRSANVTEGVSDGGTIGRPRKAVRDVRATVTLVAKGRDALDYGISWLSSALDPGRCGVHSSACGTTDVTFFADCPPDYTPDDEEGWSAEVGALGRYLHDVAATSGPILVQTLKSRSGQFWGAIMEFTLTSERPWIYSATRAVELPVTPTIVIQDTPYNLVEWPSAELSPGGFTKAVITNYSTNPSVESNATGWSVGGQQGITGTLSPARSTEIAAIGSASFRGQVTATNSGTNGRIAVYQDVDISAAPASARASVNLWSTLILSSGTASLDRIDMQIQWRSSTGSVLRTDSIGTQSPSGGVLGAAGIVIPDGATVARVLAWGYVNSWSTGAVLSLYADALAVTVP